MAKISAISHSRQSDETLVHQVCPPLPTNGLVFIAAPGVRTWHGNKKQPRSEHVPLSIVWHLWVSQVTLLPQPTCHFQLTNTARCQCTGYRRGHNHNKLGEAASDSVGPPNMLAHIFLQTTCLEIIPQYRMRLLFDDCARRAHRRCCLCPP